MSCLVENTSPSEVCCLDRHAFFFFPMFWVSVVFCNFFFVFSWRQKVNLLKERWQSFLAVAKKCVEIKLKPNNFPVSHFKTYSFWRNTQVPNKFCALTCEGKPKCELVLTLTATVSIFPLKLVVFGNSHHRRARFSSECSWSLVLSILAS